MHDNRNEDYVRYKVHLRAIKMESLHMTIICNSLVDILVDIPTVIVKQF